MLVASEKAATRNASFIEKGLITSLRILKKCIPTNEFDGPTKAVVRPIYAPATINRSLPRVSPVIKLPDDISHNEAIEYCSLIQLYRTTFNVIQFSGLELPNISFYLQLRILLVVI